MADHHSAERKIGDGHAEAMFRLGLRELRAATYPDSNIAQSQEYGLYGTATPGEVGEARRGEPEHENGSILAAREQEAADRAERASESRNLDLER